MAFLIDPLAKPEWCVVNPSILDMITGLLVPVVARGNTTTEKIGFNECMKAIESQLQSNGPRVAVLFVARSDICAVESLPLALSCVAGSIKLVALPKGASQRLNESVIALMEDSSQTAAFNLVENVRPPKLDWVYRAAQISRPKRKKIE